MSILVFDESDCTAIEDASDARPVNRYEPLNLLPSLARELDERAQFELSRKSLSGLIVVSLPD